MRRIALLAGTALVVFVLVAFAMIQMMPRPMKASDLLVAGSVSTLVALLVLFLALVSTSMKARDVFFRRRPKQR